MEYYIIFIIFIYITLYISYCLNLESNIKPLERQTHHQRPRIVVYIPGHKKVSAPAFVIESLKDDSDSKCLFIKMQKLALYVYGFYQNSGYYRQILLAWRSNRRVQTDG